MVIVIDNYDSFVYNIVQYLGELGWQPRVFRNNRVTPEAIEGLKPSHIIISPGPGTPLQAGVSNDVIRHFAGKVPILGICLGHQCIGHTFGGKVVSAPKPTHGKSCMIHHDGQTIFKGPPSPFEGGRYHSLVIEEACLPYELEVSARTADGVVMGVRHKKHIVEGVQFHPESIMTDVGHDILRNFLVFEGRR